MRKRVGIWALGLTGSVLAHVAMLVVLVIAVQPEPVTKQPLPTSELEVRAYQLDRTEAREQQPESQPADADTPDGQSLDAGAIPQSQAESLRPRGDPLRPGPARPQAAPEINRQASVVVPADPATTAVPQISPGMARVAQVRPDAARLGAVTRPRPRIQSAQTGATALSPAAAPSTPTPAAAIQPDPTAPVTRPAPQVVRAARPVAGSLPTALPSVDLMSGATPDIATLPVALPAVSSAQTKAPRPVVLRVAQPDVATPQALAPVPAALPAALPSLGRIPGATPDIAALSPRQPAVASARTAAPDTGSLPVARPAVAATQTLVADASPVPAAQPAVDTMLPADTPADVVAVTAPVAATVPDAVPRTTSLPRTEPRTSPVATGIPEPTMAILKQAEATDVQPAAPAPQKLRAALAFSGGGGDVDPLSIAAFQSFMQPGDIATGSDPLRDGVSGILAQVPCSRMQVAFDPDTTTLNVNGHIPDEDLRAPVLAALRARMGANITVSDNILILPRPQCGALSGIAGVGLPQSTDQITNPLLIGEDTHAAVFSFATGDLLSLDMTAPDYDAFIYLDYFDADGTVLHLEPNEFAPLRRAIAKDVHQIGARTMQDAGLKLVIGPPYGQEIAVAFAASHALYEGLRPIQEPAAAYLDWLKAQVALKRAENGDFKGEWVYFFVATTDR